MLRWQPFFRLRGSVARFKPFRPLLAEEDRSTPPAIDATSEGRAREAWIRGASTTLLRLRAATLTSSEVLSTALRTWKQLVYQVRGSGDLEVAVVHPGIRMEMYEEICRDPLF